MKHMVTVVIPVYNSEKYLGDCLESVRNQTYTNFECIIVDDGSTDASGQICDLFCSEDTRFQVFHNDNHGVSFSRNFGIEKASGTYLTFIDSDDVVDVKILEKLVDGIEQKGADICFCKYDLFDENGTYPVVEEKLVSTEVNNDAEYFDSFLKYFFISNARNHDEIIMGSSCRILFRRDNIRYQFSTKISMCEDLLFVLNNLLGIKKIEVISESLYHYRQVGASASHKYKDNYLENQKALFEGFSQFCKRLDFGSEKLLDGEYAIRTYFLFVQELKFRSLNKNSFKERIKRIKQDSISRNLNLKNWFKIRFKAVKLKYLCLWLILKLGIYHLM